MNSVPSNQSTSSYHPPSSLIIIRELSSPRSLKSILIQPGEIIFLGRAGKSRYSARNNNGYFDNPSLRAAHALLKCSRRSGRIYLHDRSSTIYDPPDGNCLMNGDKLKGRTFVENGDDITLRAAEGLSTVLNISIVPQFDKPSQLSPIAHVSYGCAYGCEPRHPTSSQHRAVSRIRESEDGPRVFSQSNPSPISQNLNPPKVLALAFKPSISPELSAFKAPVPPHTTPFQSLNNPNDVKSNNDNNEYEEDSNVTTESNTESNPTEITSSSRSITSFPETVKSTSESVPQSDYIEYQFSTLQNARIDIVLQRIKIAILESKGNCNSDSDNKSKRREILISRTSRFDVVLQRIQAAINAIQLQAQEPPKSPIDDTPLHKRSSHIIADNAFVTSHALLDSIRVTVISHALIVRCIEEIFRAWIYVHHVFSYITRHLLGLKSASSTIAHVDLLLT